MAFTQRIHHTLCLLLTSLLFTACVEGDDYNLTPEDNFEALWTAIDEHYCFLDYKAEAIGLDWNNVHTQYKARINPHMNNTQLQEVLTDMLSELRDGHVNLYTSRDVSRYWHWHEDYPKNLNKAVRDNYLGTDYKISSGLKYRILDDNIGYVVYESFQHAVGDGNLDEVLYYLRTCNGLIIDVRSNTGGSLEYAERIASRFTNEKILVGYISHKTGKGHSEFSTPKAEYLTPSKNIRWQKKVAVLTNRECYSATNTFVRNMKCCPNVTIIGDQTGGGSGMPFSSELPNGWAIRFSACPMYDKDMKQIEFGIQPDITCSIDESDTIHDKIIETARTLLNY